LGFFDREIPEANGRFCRERLRERRRQVVHFKQVVGSDRTDHSGIGIRDRLVEKRPKLLTFARDSVPEEKIFELVDHEEEWFVACFCDGFLAERREEVGNGRVYAPRMLRLPQVVKSPPDQNLESILFQQ